MSQDSLLLTRYFPPHATPLDRRPFRYRTEQGVKWIVMTDPTILGLGQLATFRSAVGAHSMVSHETLGLFLFILPSEHVSRDTAG